jgi:uncharacterized SAM-dependent methyltransferase
MSFLQGSLDLFTERRVSHMGSYQYVSHAGARNGQSMSGAKLWADLESKELNSDRTNLFSAEEILLDKVAHGINDFIPSQTPILELGPGTLEAFSKKTLPIIKAVRTTECIFVDESRSFLNDISTCKDLKGIQSKLIEDDFLEGDFCYREDDTNTLACLFGSTISNILSPVLDASPRTSLTDTLRKLAHTINNGWLLISFDANQNGKEIENFYTRQALFQLNVFYRMAVELPVDSDFDPSAFTYKAEWNASSGQLAHIAVVEHAQNFMLGNQQIRLRKGQKLHLKNSYKFHPGFFEECCIQANLGIVKSWSDYSDAKVYLLQKQNIFAHGFARSTLLQQRA